MQLKSSVNKWAVLCVAGIAQFLVLLESTIINVALPSIDQTLGDHGWLAWVLSGYLLAFGAFLLPGGVWADRVGKRKVFLLAASGFAISSALCAGATRIELLVAARLLQGATAGILAASALAVVLSHYVQLKDRTIAITVWSALGVVGSVIGTLIAGVLIESFGWTSIFWINVLAVAMLFPFAWKLIHSPAGTTASAPLWPAFSLAIGTAMILIGVAIIEKHMPLGASAILCGIVVIVVTVRNQLLTTRTASILPLTLFQLASYRIAATSLFLINGLMISLMFLLSYQLQQIYLVPVKTASFAVLPLALSALIAAFLAELIIAKLTRRTTYHLAGGLLILGTALSAIATLFDAPWQLLMVTGTFIGMGIPLCFVVSNQLAYTQVPADKEGAAAGFTNMLTTLGGAVTVTFAALTLQYTNLIGAYLLLLTSAIVVAVLSLIARSHV